jgi:hypothetical protein
MHRSRNRWLGLAFVLMFVLALIAIGCGNGDDGGKCDECQTDADCTERGLSCFLFTDGEKRCAERSGDTCGGGVFPF